MNEIIERIFASGVVPVIKLDDAEDARPLCGALADGGIDVAEITFRTDAAESAIFNVTQNMPEILVGAGTILTVDSARKAVAAGARFIVTPGFNPKVVEYCLENNIIIVPGCSNPTDIEVGLGYGLKILKFFPAESCGGIKALTAMSAPYSMVKFMPTGGIDAALLSTYLSSDKIIACGGSWMVKDSLIKNKQFKQITSLTAEAVSKVHGFSFAHLGINMEDCQSASTVTDLLSGIFSLEKRELDMSFFAGDNIEIMKGSGKGQCGHIGIKTNNVKRAMAYFKKKGMEVDMSTIRGTEEKPTFVYLKNSIGPFAVHIVQ